MTATGGFCREPTSSAASVVVLALTLIAIVPAAAAPVSFFDVPSTTLDVAVLSLSRQSGVEIVSTEPGLDRIRSRAVRGRLPIGPALQQLLAGTPFEARRLGNGAFLIRRRPSPPRIVVQRRAPVIRTLPPPPPSPATIIIVQASKRQTPLIRYPGTVTSVITADPLRVGGTGKARDLTDLSATLPILQGTHLGPGRDKVFIRGIADSSFSGSTQSPTSLYWDDVQLNYSGPDPGLRLYDVSSVDVLEGPQGTLYGSGAIGGVIRVNSNPVDLSRAQGAASLGATATQHGGIGADAAGMLNLPLVGGRLGLRAVGYASSDGGYIDDRRRGLADVNRTRTEGGRLTIRSSPGDGWQIEGGGIWQMIRSADGQYGLRAAQPLSRRSFIAEPYRNRIALGRVSIGRVWSSGLRLQSTTAIVGYRSTDQFDATTLFGRLPVRYVAARRKRLLSHESRLSKAFRDGSGWVVGVSLIDNRDILSRTFIFADAPVSVTGVTNQTSSISAFIEGTRPIARRLSLTAGARITSARVDGDPSTNPQPGTFVRGHPTRRIDPTLALVWSVQSDTSLFGRLQSGFRTGGLAVAPGIGRVTDFQTDTVRMAEIGVRHLRRRPVGLAFSSSVSLTRWNDIQADLITRRGTPNTVNLGNARILAWEGSADWVPLPDLTAKGSFLMTRNRVTGAIANLSQRENRRLPNTPFFSASGELGYRWSKQAGVPVLRVSANYVGRSVLGTGDLFDVSQGHYLQIGATGGVDWRGAHWSLSAENLTNVAGNQFSFGNPFTLATREQVTPLRPRSVRFGITRRW